MSLLTSIRFFAVSVYHSFVFRVELNTQPRATYFGANDLETEAGGLVISGVQFWGAPSKATNQ